MSPEDHTALVDELIAASRGFVMVPSVREKKARATILTALEEATKKLAWWDKRSQWYQAEVARLQQERDEARRERNEFAIHHDNYARTEGALSDARLVIAELVKALRWHGVHDGACPAYTEDQWGQGTSWTDSDAEKCTCKLGAALSRASRGETTG